ncbi:MAG TPA: SPOR domain-containing protein [Bacteroidota bacterium]|nr:SPOR domain-containing protein [Bacteroidota bacterium]
MKTACFCLFIVLFLIASLPTRLNSQTYEQTIHSFVRQIAEGKSDAVAPQVASLRQQYPLTPGVMYVEGLITADGKEAIHYFTVIADSSPQNPWRADALARMVELLRASGSDKDASVRLAQLRSEYPKSGYITTSYFQTPQFANDRTLTRVASGTEYSIQVGAFAKKTNAEKLCKKIKAGGYKAEVLENLLDGKNLLYLVWVGSYLSPEAADKDLAGIKTKYRIAGVLRPRTAWKKW